MNTHGEQQWLIKLVQENGVKIILGMAITAIVNMVIMLGNLWLTSKLAPLQTSINSLSVKADENETKHVVYSKEISDLEVQHATFKEAFNGLDGKVNAMQSQIQQLYVHFLGR